jgi:hypothetical protein
LLTSIIPWAEIALLFLAAFTHPRIEDDQRVKTVGEKKGFDGKGCLEINWLNSGNMASGR